MAYEGGYTSAVNSQAGRDATTAATQRALQWLALEQQQVAAKQAQTQQQEKLAAKQWELNQKMQAPQSPAPGQASVPMQAPAPGGAPQQQSPMGAPAGGMQAMMAGAPPGGAAPQGAPPAPAPQQAMAQQPTPWITAKSAPPHLGGQPPAPMGGMGPQSPTGSPTAPMPSGPPGGVEMPKLQSFDQLFEQVQKMPGLSDSEREHVLEAGAVQMDKQNKEKLEAYKLTQEVQTAQKKAADSAAEEVLKKRLGLPPGEKIPPETLNALVAAKGDPTKVAEILTKIEAKKGAQHISINVGGAGGLTSDAKQLAAEQYLATGQLPAMYRDQKGRAEIMDMAAKLKKERGGDMSDVPSDRAAFKSDAASLVQRQRFVDTGNQFIKNMQSQADLVDKYMNKGTAGGVPALNKWIQSGRKSLAGDPDVTALDTAIRGLAREHQRIVTGVTSNAQLHVAAQETADQLLNIAQTPAQMKAAIKVMREEAVNAVQAGKDEVADIRSRMKGDSSSSGASKTVHWDDLK